MLRRSLTSLILAFLAVASDAATTTKFRMDKMNYIYDKALQHVQDRQRLLKLEGELAGFDRILMDNKEKTVSGKHDKEEVATVDRKLRTLLEKYDLEKVLDAFEKVLRAKNLKPLKKRKKQENRKEGVDVSLGDVTFGDEKLQKLWNAAQGQKFAKDELEELYSELRELEQKQRVLDDALQDLNKVPHHENKVEHADDAHIQIDAKNKRAKEANRAVHTHYEELHKKVLNQEFSPFTSLKVKKMWQEAQKSSNFTAYDLDVIREELLHFDKQLKKLDAHKEELIRVRGESAGKEGGKSTLEHLENTELEAKHEKLDRKLKKLEKYLVTKIKHSEL